jgi:DNA primase
MDSSVEALKRINLVEFLSQHYGLRFQRRGAAFACCSPFTQESSPSFFVRLVEGHWLFKDFSGGAGGTIFDFVRMKEELGSFSEALAFVRRLLGSSPLCQAKQSEGGDGSATDHSEATPAAGGSYDVGALHERLRREDPEVCRQYLLGRGIAADLVEELIDNGTVVHNRRGGRSWCTFAVRDERGQLKCLDNHAVEGKDKFVLGSKSPFSLEWEELKRAKIVFLAEGIIDYLSLKTLEYGPLPGLALLGNRLCFETSLLERAEVLLSAMDDDRGGNSVVLDLKCQYPDKEVRIYNLEGYKDPNELLVAVRLGKGRRLSPERKLQLYREFQQSDNKAELAARWGIDRSHLYEIVRDCEASLVGALASRKLGRPPKGMPVTLTEALERIKELEEQYEQEATRREELYCRSELLALRLKWAEIEAAEARGEKVDEGRGAEKKVHVKKKKRRRRS